MDVQSEIKRDSFSGLILLVLVLFVLYCLTMMSLLAVIAMELVLVDSGIFKTQKEGRSVRGV